MPLNHAAVLLLILVRVGRIMPKLSIMCTEGSPTEADLIIRQFFAKILSIVSTGSNEMVILVESMYLG